MASVIVPPLADETKRLVAVNRFTALDYAQVLKEATESVAGLSKRAGWP